MKEMENRGKFTRREWQELASLLSEEKNENRELLNRFIEEEDSLNIIRYWKESREMNSDKKIDVDKAWNNLYSRLSENGLIQETKVIRKSSIFTGTFFRIAAMILLIIGIGTAGVFYMERQNKIIITTADNQKNLQVSLPDGSNIYLNRNTKLSYRKDFGRHGRDVALTGEAFFDIASDENNPFIVDAGKAKIKVIGTSFNVITENSDSAVEVFVKTGKVMVSETNGQSNLILDPGFIGRVDSNGAEKSVNDNANYMSWKTGQLLYDGQSLDIVFRDLRKVYNMDIVADDPSILSEKWTTDPIDNQPEETIIRLICVSFNLSFNKEGNTYHLARK